MSQSVLVEQRGPVQWIAINRPDRRNALNEGVINGIYDGVEAAETNPEVCAIVLTGVGDKAFCAGGDLKLDSDSPFIADPSDPTNFVIRLFKRLEVCRLPVVARVNGHALAGGLGLLCACDMAIASEDALFGTPESGIGLYPMMIMPYLQRVLPRRKFMEMCVTGEPFTADEALRMDLINYVVPVDELDKKVSWFLNRIVNKSPTAIRLGKQAFHAMQDMAIDDAFEYAQLMLPMMAQTEDAKEGFAAFREKRKPKWTGR